MNKSEIISFFDLYAPDWDANMVIDEQKIQFILDKAEINKDITVLDVACGTGVLFPYYLKRNVSKVTGVDISPEMIRIASEKIRNECIEAICADMESLPVSRKYDRIVVYNAFPHFEEPARLIERLAMWTENGGRLTVAHSMGLDTLRRHHEGRAKTVSRAMLTAEEMAEVFMPWFCADVKISTDDIYVVSGVRK